MAISASMMKNLGSSVAFSSLDVVSKYAPNTADLLRSTARGATDLRRVIQDAAKGTNRQTMQVDRTAAGRRSRRYLENAMKGIREGNLGMRDISGDLEGDMDDILPTQSELERDVEQTIGDEENPTIPGPRQSASDVVAKAQMQLMATSAQYNMEALNQLQEVLATTQVNTTEYAVSKLNTAIFTQTSIQAQHFARVEKQLANINTNIAKMVDFQYNQVSTMNQATLAMFDQIAGYMKRSEKRELEKAKRTKSASRKAADGFMGGAALDMPQYTNIIQDNLKNSEFGALKNVFDTVMDVRKRSKDSPAEGILGMLMKAAVPRSVQRSLKSGDKGVNTMVKSTLARLGEYRYDLDNHPILGSLGAIFGIDQRKGRSVKLSGFKRGAMDWNGEAQKALTSVIPKELAELNATTKTQLSILKSMARANGYGYKTEDARYFDMQTGKSMTKDEITERTRIRYQDAMESSFANLFNKISIDPDDVMDKKIWQGLSDQIKSRINDIINQSIDSGTNVDTHKELDSLIRGNLGDSGGTGRDVVRMVNELVGAVNASRDNLAALAKDLQETESGFLQIASTLRDASGNSLVDRNGNISYRNMQKFLGPNGIDVVAANSGRYSQSGKRLDVMTEEDRAMLIGQEGLINRGLQFLSGLDQSSVKVIRNGAEKAKTALYGRNTKYTRAASGFVDKLYETGYNAAMLGQMPKMPQRERRERRASTDTDDRSDGDADPGAPPRRWHFQRRASTARSSADGVNEKTEGDNSEEPRKTRERPRLGGIVNQAFRRREGDEQYEPESRTADAVEELRDTTEAAYGEGGYMHKFFDNPLFKKLFGWLQKSALGQKAGDLWGKAKAYGKRVMTEDYVDEDGNTVDSVKTRFKKGFASFKDMIFGQLGVNPETGEAVESPTGDTTVVEQVAEMNEVVRETREMLTGESGPNKGGNPNKKIGSILKELNVAVRKHAPRAVAGAVIGGGAGLLTGGKMGLIAGTFLPGGPIGGAIAGAGIGLLSQTETFKNVMFGKMSESGEREGGLINKKMQESFKKALPTLGIGAAAGGIGYTILKFLKMGTMMPGAQLAGAMTAPFLPGGMMGAVVLGSAAAMALKNEKVQNILFGEKQEDGSRTGSFLSKAYNQFTGKLKGASKDGKGTGSIFSKAWKAVKTMGIGALTATTISQFGLLGGVMGMGGPIGGAIAGLALHILGGSDKFDQYLYGTKDGDGKRQKDGLFSRASTMIQMQILEPAGAWFKDTMTDFAWWMKDKVEVPLRIITSPIVEAFHGAADSAKEAAKDAFDKVKDSIIGKFGGIAGTIGKFMMTKVLNPVGRGIGAVLKAGLFTAGSAVAAPLKLLEFGFSGQKRKANRDMRGWMRDNKDDILAKRKADFEAKGEKYGFAQQFKDRTRFGLASMKFGGGFFQDADWLDEEGGVVDQYSDYMKAEGKEFNRKNIINQAVKDRRNYRDARKDARKEAKAEREIRRMRQKFAAEDNWNQSKIMSGTKEFDIRKKAFAKHGIDVNSVEEMREAIYDYEGRKQRLAKEAEAAQKAANGEAEPEKGTPGEEKIVQEQQETRKEHTPLFTKMVDLLGGIFKNTSRTADMTEAQVDIAGGDVFDTDDETGDVSEAIDKDKAGEIQEAKAKSGAEAQLNALREIENERERKLQRDLLTGNASGNAHDDETDNESDRDNDPILVEGEPEEKKETLFDKLGGLLSGGLGTVLKFIAPAGIAALAAALLSNEDVRNFLGSAAKTLLKTVTDGAADLVQFAAKKGWEFIKDLPGNVVNFGKDMLGIGGGVDNSRAVAVDEEGNATQTQMNTDLVKHAAQGLWTAGKTATAAGKTAKLAGKVANFTAEHTPGVGTVYKGVKAVVSAPAKIGTKLMEKATDPKASNDNLLLKAFTLIEKALDKAANSKAGKFLSNVSAGMKKITKWFGELKGKLANKLFGNLAEKLTVAIAEVTGKTVSWLTPMAILNGVVTAGAAIIGACDAEKLFRVSAKDVDGKMRVISAIMEAVCAATGMGSVIAIISDIVAEFTDINFMQQIAVFFYNVFSNEEDREKLDDAISNMEQEVKNYNLANGTNISVEAYNDLKNKGVVGGAWNKIQGLWGGGDKTDYSQYEVGNFDASKYTSNATGMGGGKRVKGGRRIGMGGGLKQNDYRWGNIPIGTLPNGQVSTMAVGGCGPTALANAINHLGGNVNPAAVGQMAANSGYITDGGANDRLFDEGAARLGVSANRVGSMSDVQASLQAGMPVVLAGKDTGGSTPFTQAGHIVTATGLDSHGNVIVDDPERNGTYAYSAKSIGSHLTAGWQVGTQQSSGGQPSSNPDNPMGYGILSILGGKIINAIMGAFSAKTGIDMTQATADDVSTVASTGVASEGGGATSGNFATIKPSEAQQYNWNWLDAMGYNDIAKAGIMGCWEQESKNRADIVEGFYLKGFPGFSQVLASNGALNSYTINTLFPAYQKSGISISKKGYLGTDGNYYPGIGLAQWTGPRGYQYFMYAKEHNMDWRDTNTQLKFFQSEIDKRGLKSQLNSSSSVAIATQRMLDGYEMYSGYSQKAPSAYQKRLGYANSIYAQYKGTAKPLSNNTAGAVAGTQVPLGGGALGYGLADSLIGTAITGGIVSGLLNRLGISTDDGTTGGGIDGGGVYSPDSAVGDWSNKVNPFDTSTQSGPGVVNGKYTYSGPGLPGQVKVVNQMGSIYGKIAYSTATSNVDAGVSSCADTVSWAYQKAHGINRMSAGAAKSANDPQFETIYVNNGNNPLDMKILQPGDIVYEDWRVTKFTNPNRMSHAEMYAGYGKDLSHGGGSSGTQPGPTLVGVKGSIPHIMKVRRYIPFIKELEEMQAKQSSSRSVGLPVGYDTQGHQLFKDADGLYYMGGQYGNSKVRISAIDAGLGPVDVNNLQPISTSVPGVTPLTTSGLTTLPTIPKTTSTTTTTSTTPTSTTTTLTPEQEALYQQRLALIQSTMPTTGSNAYQFTLPANLGKGGTNGRKPSGAKRPSFKRIGMGGVSKQRSSMDPVNFFTKSKQDTPENIINASMRSAGTAISGGLQDSVADAGMAEGYGTLDYGTSYNGNSGVETRLDRIINILATIASNTSAPKQKANVSVTSNNVNYGPGPEAKPQPVIIRQEKKQLGSEDTHNQEMRAMHRRIASVHRFR